jgi:hypothetical protein
MKDTKEHLAQLCLIEKILSNVLPERDVNNPYKKHLEKHLSEDQQVFFIVVIEPVKTVNPSIPETQVGIGQKPLPGMP